MAAIEPGDGETPTRILTWTTHTQNGEITTLHNTDTDRPDSFDDQSLLLFSARCRVLLAKRPRKYLLSFAAAGTPTQLSEAYNWGS